MEAELQKAAQRLYEKVVPAPVREYIDEADLPEGGVQRKTTVQD